MRKQRNLDRKDFLYYLKNNPMFEGFRDSLDIMCLTFGELDTLETLLDLNIQYLEDFKADILEAKEKFGVEE